MEIGSTVRRFGGRAFEGLRDLGVRTRDAAGFLGVLRLEELSSGRWFERLVRHRLAARARHPDEEAGGKEVAREPGALVNRAAFASAFLGTGAAAVTTAAEVITADTGLAGVLAIPAAAASVIGDLVARGYLHAELVIDVAAVHGVSFTPEDAVEVIALFALALDLEEIRRGQHREAIERLVDLDARSAGEAIGGRLFGETVLRNVIPFIDLAASGAASFQLTRRLGRLAADYARARFVADEVCRSLAPFGDELIEAFVEGAWFVLAVHALADEEAALLAHLVRGRGAAGRARLLDRFDADDEVTWHARLRGLDFAAREPLLRAIELCAAACRETGGPERALLRRAAEAMGIDFDPAALQTLAEALRRPAAASAPPFTPWEMGAPS